ncbi:MAG TPA: glycogen debranching N-terminal domain-containing protein [Ktedonosporobacter sp.]|nr:glycogen debranching N-terminal domain-containing protein [Ktedonosporobacter sp.]
MTNTIHQQGLDPATAEDQGTSIQPEVHEDEQQNASSPGMPTAQITLKNGDAFLIADAHGDFAASRQEMGLFWHGTRFLRTCNLFLEGRPLMVLSHHIATMGDACQIDLTNHAFTASHGFKIEQGEIHIGRQLELCSDHLIQTLTITSFHSVPVPLTLSLAVGADFRDMFEVRGTQRAQRGTLQPPRLQNDMLVLSYRGLDDIERETAITCAPRAAHTSLDKARWQLHLKRSQPIEIRIVVKLSALPDEIATPFESTVLRSPWGEIKRSIRGQGQQVLSAGNVGGQGEPKESRNQGGKEMGGAEAGTEGRTGEERKGGNDEAGFAWDDLPEPTIRTDDVLLNRLLTRGMHDLIMLTTLTPYGRYPYAGIPWFSCPFGRDGLITCLEFLPWYPSIVRGTLAFLAAHQGTKVEAFTEEEPGKILHEMRRGEMANCREIPFIPYYGSIDVTPLFLITLERYIRWTNDIAFLQQLWPHAEAAAHWLTNRGDRDGDSFIEYHKDSSKGLDNQGWKDAWDAISHKDGQLAASPIALCEVQGYAFAAYRAMSFLAQQLGQAEDVSRWEKAASTLQENFLRNFWWEEEGIFYLALDKDKKPCEVITSNPGQCLWTGIVPTEKARRIIDRLMREDMYSGWGIRTLSTQATRYNPMSYHNGSVWPHDTALVGAGFAHHGGKAEAGILLHSMLETSLYYDGARLPELHCGFAQRPGYGPTRYPVACSPQAWAAGAPFLLVNALLGLEVDAEAQRLILRQPTLPDWLHRLEINDMYIGKQRVHLRFERSGEQTTVTPGEHNEVEIQVL